MKTTLSKIVQFPLVALVVLVMLSLSVSANALSLEDTSIQFENEGIHVYDGAEWTPQFSVMLADGGELFESLDFTVTKREVGKNVGTYSVTLVGIDGFSGTLTRTYQIVPRPLTVSAQSCDKRYDGTKDAQPVLSLEGVLPGDTVTVDYASAVYDSSSAGSGKTVYLYGLQLRGADKDNYEISGSELTLKNCGSITRVPIEPEFKDAVLSIGDPPLDLRTLVTGARNSNDITFNQLSDSTGSCQFRFPNLTPGNTAGTVVFEAYVPPGEGLSSLYKGGMGTITITVVDPGSEPTPPGSGDDPDDPLVPNPPNDSTETGTKRQDPLVITGSSSMIYGQRLDLGVVGGSGSGAVTYAITGGTGSGTIDQNGRLQAAKVGTIWVTAFKAGDQTYQMRQSDAKVITVSPAKLTVTAPSKTIRVGEAIPDLAGLRCTVSGLVGSDRLRTPPSLVYASTPDAGKAGTVAIHPVGAEVPAGGNYQPDITYLSGSLTIQEEKDFLITIHPAANGTLSSDHPRAEEGATVLLTATAREGFVPEPPIVTYQNLRLVVASQGEGLYAFSMPGGPVTVTPSFVPGPPEPEGDSTAFSDVHGSDWFSDSVAYVCRHGLMVGTDERSFSPDGITTRGMLVTILYRTEGEPAASNQSHYADVPPSAYYASPVSWASWHGIASGYSADAFGPEDSISRQQLATILYRYAAYKSFDVSHRGNLVQFSDRDQISDYAIDALSWANATGLLNGKADQTLAPAASTTRAEMAAILQRFCEKYALF